MQKHNFTKNRDNSRIVGGLIIIAVGAILLLKNTGVYFPRWLFSWPMILILIAVYQAFKQNFKGSSWLILLAVGGFFLVQKAAPDLSRQPLFWPLAIIAGGVIFMLRPRHNDFVNFQSPGSSTPGSEPGNYPALPTGGLPDASDHINVRSVFSGVKRSMLSKNFQGGNISSIFGGSEIDFTQAEINGQVILNFEVLFGGAKIIIPAHWAVQNEIDGIFHGVDDNRRFNPDAALNPTKVLVLKGSVTFGGVDIRSY
ncbi:MAG: hypothetical protein EOO03_10810 [Chitinophagaceae bacterium]|nr:MAG: hypothetical protein EOO03_10810 [Chitinophagaceae bacterium]